MYSEYMHLVLKAAVLPTGRFLKDLRADLGLIVVVALVAVYQHPSGERITLADSLTAVIWGFLAAGILVALVFVWNLVQAPYRVYKAMEDELRETNWGLETELQRYRHPESQAAALREARLRQAALPLGTELRDIRHKIDIVRSTRPHPHYSHGFRLPGARWNDHHRFLAGDHADLYAIVECAYTASHHVNEALQMRETRAGAGKTLAVIPDDGLDEAYDAAGLALDALGESRGDPWVAEGQRQRSAA